MPSRRRLGRRCASIDWFGLAHHRPDGSEKRPGCSAIQTLPSPYPARSLERSTARNLTARRPWLPAASLPREYVRKNWLFCWTEVGAKHAGIVQSLIATCRLQGIDPYTHLIDLPQRVGKHPAARAAELTPRRWKALFADSPLRSDLHRSCPTGKRA